MSWRLRPAQLDALIANVPEHYHLLVDTIIQDSMRCEELVSLTADGIEPDGRIVIGAE